MTGWWIAYLKLKFDWNFLFTNNAHIAFLIVTIGDCVSGINKRIGCLMYLLQSAINTLFLYKIIWIYIWNVEAIKKEKEIANSSTIENEMSCSQLCRDAERQRNQSTAYHWFMLHLSCTSALCKLVTVLVLFCGTNYLHYFLWSSASKHTCISLFHVN